MLKLSQIFLLVIAASFLRIDAFSFDWVKLHQKAVDLQKEAAEDILAKDSDSSKGLYLLGLVYFEKYQAQKAKDVFQQIIREDPENPFARWGRIEALRRQHQCRDCKEQLNEVILAKPDFAPAYVTLAYICYKDMEFDKAARLTYQVIRMGQENVDTANYIRALGLFAGSKGMTAHYGGLLSKVINGRMVMPYLQRAKQIDPESAVVLFGLGSYYLLTPPVFGRDFDKAKEYLERAAKADPNFVDIYVRLAQAYRAQGDIDSYNQYIEKALTLDPKNELALDIKERVCDFICIE